MTDLIYTHVLAKVPDTELEFLINPYGLVFDEITACSLMRMDQDGKVPNDPKGLGCNPAGLVIHSCTHRANHQLACVIHTHSSAGISVSAQKRGLLMLSQHPMRINGALAYHDYEGVALEVDEKPRLVRALGSHQAMILRDHGSLTADATVFEVFD